MESAKIQFFEIDLRLLIFCYIGRTRTEIFTVKLITNTVFPKKRERSRFRGNSTRSFSTRVSRDQSTRGQNV